MSEADTKKTLDGQERADWNEEFDAWFELIEDHLKSIRLWLKILVVVIVILILVQLFTWMFPDLPYYYIPFFEQFRPCRLGLC